MDNCRQLWHSHVVPCYYCQLQHGGHDYGLSLVWPNHSSAVQHHRVLFGVSVSCPEAEHTLMCCFICVDYASYLAIVLKYSPGAC